MLETLVVIFWLIILIMWVLGMIGIVVNYFSDPEPPDKDITIEIYIEKKKADEMNRD